VFQARIKKKTKQKRGTVISKSINNINSCEMLAIKMLTPSHDGTLSTAHANGMVGCKNILIKINTAIIKEINLRASFFMNWQKNVLRATPSLGFLVLFEFMFVPRQ
jgi:hypothetical protein